MEKPKFWLPLPSLLDAKGRVSRLQFLIYCLIYGAGYVGLILLISSPVVQTMQPVMAAAVFVPSMLAFVYLSACVNMKRLHDLGWPGALALVQLTDMPLMIFQLVGVMFNYHNVMVDRIEGIIDPFLRVVSGVLGLILLVRRGVGGANKYGPDPLQSPQAPSDIF